MAVDSRSPPRPPGQLRPGADAMSALRYSFTFLADNWRQAAANDESGVP